MGMAASQARYLALTARKTNVEYEGQQINQARTALANQSANTFNDLLSLEVPTAPSTQDFTKLIYSFEEGLEKETISGMAKLENDPDGYNYSVTHYHYSDIYTGVQNKLANPQVVENDKSQKGAISRDAVQVDAEGNYTIDGRSVQTYDPTNIEAKNVLDRLLQDYPSLSQDLGDLRYFIDSDGVIHFTSQKSLEGEGDIPDYYIERGVPTYVGNCELTKYNPNDAEQKSAYEQIIKDWPESSLATSDPNDIYVWVYQGETRFASHTDLHNAAISGPNPQHPTENQDKLTYYVAQNISTKIEQTEKAMIDLDENGRPQSIKFEDSSATYSLSTETITDDAAYQDAMNQYNYNMEVYEKRIQDINAKTKKIQEQDRTLELRLRQLDTEQEALQTEMEAVQKVIQKNIESTFKTFE